MIPPSAAAIFEFLRRYRGEATEHSKKDRPDRIKRADVFRVLASIRKEKKRPKRMSDESFHTLLDGKRVNPPFDDVLDIIEAHGFRCFDLFVDFFHLSTVDDVNIIRKRASANIGNAAEMLRVDPTYLGKNHRTKIDIVEIAPGGHTDFHFHQGHEFVWVHSGKVRVDFEDRSLKARSEILEPQDSISFSSLVKHRFTNIGTSKATLVAARPANSKPVEEESPEWFYDTGFWSS